MRTSTFNLFNRLREDIMTRFLSASVFALVVLTLLSAPAARAQEAPNRQQDDRVIIDLSGEDWVTTKTARVTVNVEAAVSASNAGSTREEMYKAVNDLVKADWRLTEFNRSQDSTGLEHWSAGFEARVPENQLSGLGEMAKKVSKAGMQVSVGDIDFSPTLEEMETARAAVRAQIYKEANDQLTAVNAAIPGRNYRIALINFAGDDQPMPQPPRSFITKTHMMAMGAPAAAPEAPAERAEKVTLSARVVFAATPPEHPTPAPH
jgi:uncharacterized protein YggE